jgi:hypothetical protein
MEIDQQCKGLPGSPEQLRPSDARRGNEKTGGFEWYFPARKKPRRNQAAHVNSSGSKSPRLIENVLSQASLFAWAEN